MGSRAVQVALYSVVHYTSTFNLFLNFWQNRTLYLHFLRSMTRCWKEWWRQLRMTLKSTSTSRPSSGQSGARSTGSWCSWLRSRGATRTWTKTRISRRGSRMTRSLPTPITTWTIGELNWNCLIKLKKNFGTNFK